MGKISFNDAAAIQLAGIGVGAALNAYLGKKEADKYGLSPEEKRTLMIRRGLKGAALGALGASTITIPTVMNRTSKAFDTNPDFNPYTDIKPGLSAVSGPASNLSILGGIGGHFYGQDVRRKVDRLKRQQEELEDTKTQARLFAEGGGKLAEFGKKAMDWWNKRSNTQKGAIIGGVAGAGIGAAKKGIKGAVAGAAGGAAVGAGAGMAYNKWGNGALKNVLKKKDDTTLLLNQKNQSNVSGYIPTKLFSKYTPVIIRNY